MFIGSKRKIETITLQFETNTKMNRQWRLLEGLGASEALSSFCLLFHLQVFRNILYDLL